MSNQYDDLRREIIRRRDTQSKMKLVKALRRIIKDYDSNLDMNKMIQSMQIGFRNDVVVAIIEAPYPSAVVIKTALNNHKLLKFFDIQFKMDATYPANSIAETVPPIQTV
jgi:hypothetical protein